MALRLVVKNHRILWIAPLVLFAGAMVFLSRGFAEDDMKPSTQPATTQASTQPISKSQEEWQHCLNPQQYRVLREKGTEAPFSGRYNDTDEPGVYHCAACDAPLFGWKTKFHSGTGWPSFFAPISPEAIKTVVDNAHGMERTEVVCGTCGSHLGHVFEDGPPPTGLRYCLNSVALVLKKD